MSSKFYNIEFPLVQVPVWSLKMEEPFRNLFPIRQTVLAEIIDEYRMTPFIICESREVMAEDALIMKNCHKNV